MYFLKIGFLPITLVNFNRSQ